MEEALVHRKRSSRIAMREIEKEEARVAAIKKAEEDEKMARVRRAEARAREKDAEREAREKAREQRRLEREERVKHDQEEKEREKYVLFSHHGSSRVLTARSAEVDVVTMTPAPAPSVNGASSSKRASHTPSGVRSPDWILDCEICQKSGRNLVSSTLYRASCRSLTKFRLGRWHRDGVLQRLSEVAAHTLSRHGGSSGRQASEELESRPILLPALPPRTQSRHQRQYSPASSGRPLRLCASIARTEGDHSARHVPTPAPAQRHPLCAVPGLRKRHTVSPATAIYQPNGSTVFIPTDAAAPSWARRHLVLSLPARTGRLFAHPDAADVASPVVAKRIPGAEWHTFATFVVDAGPTILPEWDV